MDIVHKFVCFLLLVVFPPFAQAQCPSGYRSLNQYTFTFCVCANPPSCPGGSFPTGAKYSCVENGQYNCGTYQCNPYQCNPRSCNCKWYCFGGCCETCYDTCYQTCITYCPAQCQACEYCVLTDAPTRQPTRQPTPQPTVFPTKAPTKSPVPTPDPTPSPTRSPTMYPTNYPTEAPTLFPTLSPTMSPVPPTTPDPTAAPVPTPEPTPPTFSPTLLPTTSPTVQELFSQQNIMIFGIILGAGGGVSIAAFVFIYRRRRSNALNDTSAAEELLEWKVRNKVKDGEEVGLLNPMYDAEMDGGKASAALGSTALVPKPDLAQQRLSLKGLNVHAWLKEAKEEEKAKRESLKGAEEPLKMQMKWDFEGENDDELSAKAGDVLICLDKRDEWFVAHNPSTGKTGIIPCDYVAQYLADEDI